MARETSEPDTPGGRRLPGRLRRQIVTARAVVLWERLWPRLWPALALLGTFAGLAMLGAITALPPWLHALVLLAVVAGAGASLYRNLRDLRMPDSYTGSRRIEQASGLGHRPLTTMDDPLAAGANDPAAASLWRAHRAKLTRMLAQLRVGWPRAGLAGQDPRALRAIPVLLIAAGVIASGPTAPERLLRALMPAIGGTGAPPPSVTVWLDPPSYTGKAPRVLNGASGDAESQLPGEAEAQDTESGGEARDKDGTRRVVRAPEGSRVLVQVNGGDSQPAVLVGDTRKPLESVSKDAWKGEIVLGGANGVTVPGGADLGVVQAGDTLAEWPLHLLIDQKPTVAFTDEPREGQRHALEIEHRAEDDYGVTALRLVVDRPGDERIEPIVRRLPLTGDDGSGTLTGTTYHDLTAHIWAGLEAEMVLEAEDAAGQTATSETRTVELPERSFKHPVAKKLVELRKRLARKPDARKPVIRELQKLQTRPDRFLGDIVVALGLRTAERRLAYSESFAELRSVQELMWRLALRIEDGELAIAERDLRRAQKALQEALADPETSNAEIQRLMDRLEQAMQRFMQAMQQRMQQRMSEGEQPQPMPENAQRLEARDLQKMLERMRDMATSGSREAAQEMLSRLQQMMENLRMAPQQRMSQQGRQAQEMMQNLQSLSQRQQNLLDQTFRQAQPGQEGRRQPGQGQRQGQQPGQMQPGQGPGAQQQEAIRKDLGELMRRYSNMMGEIPGALGQAEQQMRQSQRALGQGQPGQAVKPQKGALENLRQGMQSMQQALRQRLQQQQGPGRQGQGRFGARPGDQRDPLGRRQGEDGRGGMKQDDVRIPDEQQIQRAREILDELRRRAGERERPEIEREYIERLLERF